MADQGSRFTPMTPEQFRVIATLLRSRAHIREVCEKVLLGGESPAVVARAAGLEYHLVTKALIRYRSTHEMLLSAYAGNPSSVA